MRTFLIQIQGEPVTSAFTKIGEYGLLGAIVIILSFALIFVIKKLIGNYNKIELNNNNIIKELTDRIDDLEDKADNREKEFRSFIINENTHNQKIISKNTEAINNFSKIMERLENKK